MKIQKIWDGLNQFEGMPIIEVRIYEANKRAIAGQIIIIHLKKYESGDVRVKSPHSDLNELLLTAPTRSEAMQKTIRWLRTTNNGRIPKAIIFLNADKAKD